MESRSRLLPLPPGTAIRGVHVEGLLAEWVIPPGRSARGVMLYLHGGAFSMGSRRTHRAFVARLAAASHLQALSIDYRLAPEHPFPAGLEDVLTAYRWLLHQGTPAKRLVIAGDSAGGNLALAALLSLRDAGETLPAAAVCLSPATVLHWGDRSGSRRDPLVRRDALGHLIDAYIGKHDPHLPLLSPLYADLPGLPPLLIQVGTNEMLLPSVQEFAERARKAGVEVTLEVWEGMWHVWQMTTPLVPEATRAVKRIGLFVEQHLGRRAECQQ